MSVIIPSLLAECRLAAARSGLSLDLPLTLRVDRSTGHLDAVALAGGRAVRNSLARAAWRWARRIEGGLGLRVDVVQASFGPESPDGAPVAVEPFAPSMTVALHGAPGIPWAQLAGLGGLDVTVDLQAGTAPRDPVSRRIRARAPDGGWALDGDLPAARLLDGLPALFDAMPGLRALCVTLEVAAPSAHQRMRGRLAADNGGAPR